VKFLKKIEWNLAALVMAPLVGVETREKEKRLRERLERAKQRYRPVLY
jgi:gas vesicle protein